MVLYFSHFSVIQWTNRLKTTRKQNVNNELCITNSMTKYVLATWTLSIFCNVTRTKWFAFVYVSKFDILSCPCRSTGFSEVIVVVGGCERMGGFNLPYTECYDPVTGEWKSLAKLPEFTKSEYAVCALRNDILVSGNHSWALNCFVGNCR